MRRRAQTLASQERSAARRVHHFNMAATGGCKPQDVPYLHAQAAQLAREAQAQTYYGRDRASEYQAAALTFLPEFRRFEAIDTLAGVYEFMFTS